MLQDREETDTHPIPTLAKTNVQEKLSEVHLPRKFCSTKGGEGFTSSQVRLFLLGRYKLSVFLAE